MGLTAPGVATLQASGRMLARKTRRRNSKSTLANSKISKSFVKMKVQ